MSVRRKTAPYADTEISPLRSKEQIEKLLRDFGADAVQWSESWKDRRAQVQFVIDDKGRKLLVRLEPPPFSAKRKTWVAEKGRYEQLDEPNWAQSYRLLFYYLKAKLQAITWGLRDLEEEFLPDLVVRDREGREGTVRELFHQQLASGEIRPALPGSVDVVEQSTATVDGRVLS